MPIPCHVSGPLTRGSAYQLCKLLQLDTFLKGKRKITSEALLKHLDGVERFISAKVTGTNYAWAIDLMDHGSTVKVSMNADLLARDVDDVTT